MFAYYGVWSDFVWLMIGAEISAQDWFFFFFGPKLWLGFCYGKGVCLL